MAHDVFISYSTADKPAADAVCAGLEQRGFSCWIAPRDIVPGLDWGAAIIDAINDAKVMVLVFSSSANTSKQIKREVERAVSKGVTLIPLRIEDVPLGKTLEYFISSEHWMDALSRPLDPHVDRLAAAIRALLARPSKAIDTGVRIARQASGAHPAASAQAFPDTTPIPAPAPVPPQPFARPQPAPAAAVSRPGKFRPLPLVAAAVVLLAVLAALGVFKAPPPQLLSVQFPARIYSNNQPASGLVFFRTKKSDIASARFEVVSAVSFPPVSFSVQGVAGRREGSFGFYLHTPVAQRITLKAVITDTAGHDSNPVPFTFEAVPAPVPQVAPPPAPSVRGRRGRVDIQVPNFHFRVR